MARTAFRIPIGDWSGDGHGQCEWFEASASKMLNEVREAYFAGLKKIPKHLSPEVLCAKYEDNRLTESVRQELLALTEIEFDEDYNDAGTFADYVVWVINHGDPEVIARLEPVSGSLMFSGYDRQNRHIGPIGYGLFSL